MERALTIWQCSTGRLYAECHDTAGWWVEDGGEWHRTLMPFGCLVPVCQVLVVFDGVVSC